MSFHEVLIDDGLIIYETEGGPEYSTDVVRTESGARYANSNWDEALGRWNVGDRDMLYPELQVMLAFFRARKGKAIGFRMKDWGDHICPMTEGRLRPSGAGDNGSVGGGVPTYDCWRRYADAAGSDDRRLWKLAAGTVVVYRNGSAVTVGAGAGQVSIDINSGRVTFAADASSIASSITPGATTQVVLASNPGALTSGKLLYLAGFGGADAALVNDRAHEILAVAGSGPYTFTLDVDTAGSTITTGSGTGAKYPQASDALACECEFHVPVAFDTDAIRYRFLAKDGANSLFRLSALPVVELLDP